MQIGELTHYSNVQPPLSLVQRYEVCYPDYGMPVPSGSTMREAALHLDRFRTAIDAEVNRRLGRGEPTPHIRAEIIRRFRTFCRLGSMNLDNARPSLDGIGGTTAAALERVVETAVEIALACGTTPDVADALRFLAERFRGGVRRIMQPSEPDQKKRQRKKTTNAGRRVRSAIDRITDSYIALCLETGKIYDLNPAAEALLGVDSKALLQKPLADLIADVSRERFSDLESRLDAGEDSPPTSLTLARPAGDSVTVEVSIANHTISGKRLAIFVARERVEIEIPKTTRREPAPRRESSRLKNLRLW